MKKIITLIITLVTINTFAFEDAEVFGAWAYVETKDAFTDEVTKAVVTQRGNHTLIIGKASEPPYLRIMFSWGKYLHTNSSGSINIIQRVDQNQPITWSRTLVMRNRTGVPLGNSRELIRDMIKGDEQIALRVRDARDGETITAIFPLQGFKDAWRRLNE